MGSRRRGGSRERWSTRPRGPSCTVPIATADGHAECISDVALQRSQLDQIAVALGAEVNAVCVHDQLDCIAWCFVLPYSSRARIVGLFEPFRTPSLTLLSVL